MKTTNIRFLIILAAAIMMSLQSYAQRKHLKNTHSTSSVSSIYADSLKQYRHLLDSVMAVNDSLQAINGTQIKGDYFSFFTPMSYDPTVMQRHFRLGEGDSSMTDCALENIYMKRPDLVSLRKVNSEGTTETAKQVEAVPERVELTKQVEKKVTTTDPVISDVSEGPLDLYVTKPNFWKFSGDYYLQFMQTFVSKNWYKSGSNNYSMLGQVTLQYNYNNKQKIKWDNKLEMKLGFQASEADTINKFKSSEDLIRYTGKFGLQAHKKWYYTLQLVANTQFTQGKKDNQTRVYSDFMSPFNVNISLGMDYSVETKSKKLTGTVHLAPLAFNFKYVDRKYLATSFGITDGHRTLEDFGSTFTVELKWKPSDTFQWQTRLYGYTTYHKYEMEWENTMSLKFNKYISAVLFLYPRFDDSAKRVDNNSYFQFKEYLSFGFTYSM